MNSDKALSTARILAFNWEQDDESLSVLADRIRDAILKACAEQREADAKICDVVGDNAVGDHEPGGAYACASAIRKEQA
jgi:hypothetical protein